MGMPVMPKGPPRERMYTYWYALDSIIELSRF